MSDKYGVGDHPYCYSGTTVLKNRLNITDADELSRVEGEVAALRAETLTPQFDRFDAVRLCQIHRHLFQDIYDWAGKYRRVDIARNDTLFCTVPRIEPELKKLFNKLESADWLAALPLPEFVNQVADYYCEINVVHPFREGNGRAQRLLFEEIIVNAGFDVDWACIDRNEWVVANEAGYHGDLQPLLDVFSRAVYAPQDG